MQVRQKVTEVTQLAHGIVHGKHDGTPLADKLKIVVFGHVDVAIHSTLPTP